VEDSVFGNFMKLNPLDFYAGTLFIKTKGRKQMPGDGLPFTVGVGCQEQRIRPLEGRFDCIEVFFAFRQHMILRLEAFLNID